MTNEKQNPNELTQSLDKAMGFFNFHGRIAQKTPEGYIMGGMIFPTYEELEKAYNEALKSMGENIK